MARRAGKRVAARVSLAIAVLVAVAVVAIATTDHGSPRRSNTSFARTAAAPKSPVTLEWVGDIALSTAQGLPPGGLTGAVAPVKKILQDADVTLGNLEGTLSSGGDSKCGDDDGGGTCFAFQAPGYIASQLHAAGFDLVNQANNHALDYGDSGQAQTLAALHGAHVLYTGLPGSITYGTFAGRRIAFLGFAPYDYDGNLLDIPAAEKLVRRAARNASLVVVIIHAGAEGADQTHTPYGPQYYLGEDRGDARRFAHAAIDAGASIVLGSGPHVIRGIERYHNRLIAYSLGNFVGYRTLGTGGVLSESGILRVTLSGNGEVSAGRWISVALPDGLPLRDPTNASAHLVAALSKQDFPSDHYTIGPSGLFHIAH
jgi:poly-gamma-glutamate capsule biosynthesis protein CapA/YwtB (metallophosphatase superfamily)